MLTMFTLLAVAGGALRLALEWQMKARWGLSFALPQTLAVLLLVWAALPGWLVPVTFPLPMSVTLGAVFPDLLFVRRAS
jgi:hypothetical protein